MKSCLFCEIAAGRAPASIVWEDEHCVVFMDLYPIRRGHTLVAPRRHAVHLHELPEDLRSHLFVIATRVLQAQRDAGLRCDGANVLVNDGPAAGQHVPHVHVHAVPRARGDRVSFLGSMLARAVSVFGRAARRPRLDEVAGELRRRMEEG